MPKAIIKLAYKQVIDRHSEGKFEKNVFDDTYAAFLMQSQNYNSGRKLRTLEEMIKENPKANSLNYKVGFAIALAIKSLNNIIPGLTDSLAINKIQFESYTFHIIASDIKNKKVHKVAIIYRTTMYSLLDLLGENMILANGDLTFQSENPHMEVLMIKMQPSLSICSWMDLNNHVFSDDFYKKSSGL
jgi:hypothetical protein